MDTEVRKYNEDYCFSEILTENFLSSYFLKTPKWGFNGLGYIVYKRTYARKIVEGLSEEWWQTVARCVNGAQKIGAKYSKEEAEKLFDLVFNLKCNFAGRMLWQLGTSTVDRFGLASLLNCWWVSMREIEDFCFVFEHLMLGGGVGFSVRREDIHELPRVKKGVSVVHNKVKDADFIVPDSRQGWVELVRRVTQSYFVTGKSFTYSTILVRGSGEPISGFGGTASGPQILIEGLESICGVLKNREGKKLRSVDVLDINNIIGDIVVAGNVRRSAEIAVGDPDDYLYLRAKNWSSGTVPNWRSKSNNSIDADTFKHISEEIWDNGYVLDPKTGMAKGEPYGFINMRLCQKYGRIGEEKKDNAEGVNPCLPEWAQVLTPNGISMLRDVKIGDKIWSKEGWTNVINKWSTGIKKVYQYKTTGAVFYSTDNHEIVSNGVKIPVSLADNLDTVTGGVFSDITNLDPQDIMDGLVFGDGMIHKASNDLVLLNIGQDDYDYFDSEISHLINRKRDGVSKYGYEVETTIKPSDLVRTFDRQFPNRFLRSNQAKLRGFLRGLYSANGSICGNRIALKASSFDVIESAQAALSSLGISSYHTTNKPSIVDFANGTYQCKESYDLNISTDRSKFYQLVGFIQIYKTDKLVTIINSVRPNNKKKSNFEIFESSFVSEEEVFDITVDNESHTFWCNGVDTSNCAEITLADGEACNLSELYLNNIDSEEELFECAKLLYKTQKAVWNLPALYEKTEKIVKKNRRIGLGVTGICQSLDKVAWLDGCYNKLKTYDQAWSKELGIPESIKLTTVKPSGTLSLLGGSTSGVHPAYSRYLIRRVRMASADPLVKLCREAGYKTEYVRRFDGSEDYGTTVVEFPCEFEESTITASQMGAIDQLELTKKLQKIWADNSVSVTVYYKPEELPEIKAWMAENYEKHMKTLSFLMHSKHGFIQAPLEEITEEEYFRLFKKVKPIKALFDVGSETLDGLECEGGACPVR